MPPAFYYMPYYVDQENGWAVNSSSFDRMTQFDLPQRKNSYFFHLGALDSSYVEISKRHKTNSRQIEALTKVTEKYSKEPLNNSLCSVPTRCISRHLPLVKMISAQNSHYLSAFLLPFLKKGRLPPLYQVTESFRPAMASAYKLAQANMAYSRFSFFFRPRYTVFL